MGHPAGSPGLNSQTGILPSRRNLALCQYGQEKAKEEIRKEAHQKEARAEACHEADCTTPCRESHQRADLAVVGGGDNYEGLLPIAQIQPFARSSKI